MRHRLSMLISFHSNTFYFCWVTYTNQSWHPGKFLSGTKYAYLVDIMLYKWITKLCDNVVAVEDDKEADKEADTETTEETETETRYNYQAMLQRDKRRWARADVDGDGGLSKEEFSHFLHPEEADHMKDIIIDVRFNYYI